MAEVEVRNVTLRFGALKALDDVSLVFPDGQFFGLLGPSGSGKTTLLRAIAGFIFPDSGSVLIGGAPVEHVPVEKREIGMMFQSYALFPNMSVADNIAFGLTVRRVAGAEIRRRVGEVLDLVQLLARTSPKQSPFETLSEASKVIRQIPRDLDCAMLVVSHANKRGEPYSCPELAGDLHGLWYLKKAGKPDVSRPELVPMVLEVRMMRRPTSIPTPAKVPLWGHADTLRFTAEDY